MKFINTLQANSIELDGTPLGGGYTPQGVELTLNSFMKLVSDSNLDPGVTYQITDYHPSRYQYDLLIRAESYNSYSTTLGACPHRGETYYSKSDLSKWDIRVANIVNGTEVLSSLGSVTYMKDEFGNEANFDFKNTIMNARANNVFKVGYLFSVEVNGTLVEATARQGQDGLIRNNRILCSIPQYTHGLIFLTEPNKETRGNEFISSSSASEVIIGPGAIGNTFGTIGTVYIGSGFENNNVATNSRSVTLQLPGYTESVTLDGDPFFGLSIIGDNCKDNTIIALHNVAELTLGNGCSGNYLAIVGTMTFGNNCTGNYAYKVSQLIVRDRCNDNQIGAVKEFKDLTEEALFIRLENDSNGNKISGISTSSSLRIGPNSNNNTVNSDNVVINSSNDNYVSEDYSMGGVKLENNCNRNNITNSNCYLKNYCCDNTISKVSDGVSIALLHDYSSGNTIAGGSYYISFRTGSRFCYNIVTPTDNSNSSIYGDDCHHNLIKGGGNKLGNNCYNNKFLGGSSGNQLGDDCHDNVFGFEGNTNTLNVNSVTAGKNFSGNIMYDGNGSRFGDDCVDNIIGDFDIATESLNHGSNAANCKVRHNFSRNKFLTGHIQPQSSSNVDDFTNNTIDLNGPNMCPKPGCSGNFIKTGGSPVNLGLNCKNNVINVNGIGSIEFGDYCSENTILNETNKSNIVNLGNNNIGNKITPFIPFSGSVEGLMVTTGSDCCHNTIAAYASFIMGSNCKLNNVTWYGTTVHGVGNNAVRNTIIAYYPGEIGENCRDNYIYSKVGGWSIGANCTNNRFEFYGSTFKIGASCTYNVIKSSGYTEIGDECVGNNINGDYTDSYGTHGSTIYIGSQCKYNDVQMGGISNSMHNLVILGDQSVGNVIKAGVAGPTSGTNKFKLTNCKIYSSLIKNSDSPALKVSNSIVMGSGVWIDFSMDKCTLDIEGSDQIISLKGESKFMKLTDVTIKGVTSLKLKSSSYLIPLELSGSSVTVI